MLRPLALALSLLLPHPIAAQSPTAIVEQAVEDHILPRYATLVTETEHLAAIAEDACLAGNPRLEAAYHAAFDAWIGVSHITFGPAETDGRLFALAFWPDTRGMAARSLAGLIAAEDAVVQDQAEYATVSVAARGFHALDFLLFDPDVSTMGRAEYRCALAQAITRDIAATAALIHTDWTGGFADLMREAGRNERFQSPDEAVRILFGALSTGLEFTADLRLGRPLGSFDAPRPNRAEARRSGRSARHVDLSLVALSDLARILSQGHGTLQSDFASAFATALERIRTLDDPTFVSVTDPQGRLRIEVLQQRVRDIRALAVTELGPALGVAAGFNSLDGD